MIYYSIDSRARDKVYFGLVLVSVALASAVPYLTNLVSMKLTAPSAMIIFYWLFPVFERHLWRWPCIHWFASIPLIEGTWTGTLVRHDDSNTTAQPRAVSLSVTQNWRTMSVILHGTHSKSHAQVIALSITNKNDIVLRYIYLAKDNSGVNPTNLYGEGTAELTFKRESTTETLSGVYYSSKLRKGFLSLTKATAS